MIMDKMDLSSGGPYQLSFDLAHAGDPLFSSNFVFSGSDDCGTTWTELFSGTSSELKTANIPDGKFFAPKKDEWISKTIDLKQFASSSELMLKFEVQTSNIGWYYIDNMRPLHIK